MKAHTNKKSEREREREDGKESARESKCANKQKKTSEFPTDSIVCMYTLQKLNANIALQICSI